MWPLPFVLEMAFLVALLAVLIFSRRWRRFAAAGLAIYAALSFTLRS